MDVYCLVKQVERNYFEPTAKLIRDVRARGQAVLPCNTESELRLDAIDHYGSVTMGEAHMHKADALMVVGGQKSIVQWLRAHGDRPRITIPFPDRYIYFARQRDLLGKNKTLLVLTPQHFVMYKGREGELLQTEFNYESITPMVLARDLERMFVKYGKKMITL